MNNPIICAQGLETAMRYLQQIIRTPGMVDAFGLLTQDMKDAINGVASLDENRKLIQMPTAMDIGLGSVNNTADKDKAVKSATQLTTARKIGNASFNGTADITLAQIGASASNHTHPAQTTITGNAATATKLQTERTVDGVKFNGSANITHYGVCSTAAATAAKVVACTGFVLATGAKITVKFTATNTAANPTLNVAGTGAKPIFYHGAAISAGYLSANRTLGFVYNGTQFELIGDIDTNNKYTAASVAPKAAGTAAVGTSTKYAREDHVHPLQTTVTGNAGSATKLATARKIGNASFNGTADITLAQIGVPISLAQKKCTITTSGCTYAAQSIWETVFGKFIMVAGYINISSCSGKGAFNIKGNFSNSTFGSAIGILMLYNKGVTYMLKGGNDGTLTPRTMSGNTVVSCNTIGAAGWGNLFFISNGT